MKFRHQLKEAQELNHLTQITHQLKMTLGILGASERNQHLRTHLSYPHTNMYQKKIKMILAFHRIVKSRTSTKKGTGNTPSCCTRHRPRNPVAPNTAATMPLPGTTILSVDTIQHIFKEEVEFHKL